MRETLINENEEEETRENVQTECTGIQNEVENNDQSIKKSEKKLSNEKSVEVNNSGGNQKYPSQEESSKNEKKVENESENESENELVPGANWKDYFLEPFVFIYSFASFLSMTCLINLYMERSCLINFNLTAEVCNNLTAYPEEKNQVHIFANNINLFSTLITTLPAACVAMFIGPWSDKYGRMPPIIFSVFTNIIQDVGLLIFAYLDYLPTQYVLIAAIPVSCSGGLITVLGGFYSLVTEKSQPNKRTTKYALLEGMVFVGMTCGSLASGQIYNYYGYLPIFGTELAMHAVAFLVLFLFIKDNRLSKKEANFQTKLKDFFSMERMKDSFQTCMRVRENRGRAQIWCLIGSMCFVMMAYTSLSSILFLFCNSLYGWQLPYYSVVSNVSVVSSVLLITVTATFLSRKLKMKDLGLGLIGIISLASQTLIRAFAFKPFLYFIALGAGSLNGLSFLAIRSRLSKLVTKDEIGKVFAILAVFESLVPLPSGIIFSQIYNASLDFYPGLTFLCAGVLLLLPIAAFIWMIRLPQTAPSVAIKETGCEEGNIIDSNRVNTSINNIKPDNSV